MKITKILSLAMVAVMLVLALVSCGAKNGVTVTLQDSDGNVIGEISEVVASVKANQTYADAMAIAIEGKSDFSYDWPEGGDLKSITYGEETYEMDYTDETDGSFYTWKIVSVNGAAPESGIGLNSVATAGDVIVVKYTKTESESAVFSVADADGNVLAEDIRIDFKQAGKNKYIAEIVEEVCNEAGVPCELNSNGNGIKELNNVPVEGTVEVKDHATFTNLSGVNAGTRADKLTVGATYTITVK